MQYTNRSTAQLIENQNNSQVTYRNQISNFQTHHILSQQMYSYVAKGNSTIIYQFFFKENAKYPVWT